MGLIDVISMVEIVEDPEIEGVAKLLIPLVGTAFTLHVRKILFGEEK